MLASNASHFVPGPDSAAEPYFALRILATLLTIIAALIMVVGALLTVVIILGSLGSAGIAARIAPAGAVASIAGAGLLGGLVVLLVAAVYALALWASAQGIRLMLSLEGRARESAALQRAMLAELRRIGIAPAR
ncbi:MAG: hypothetical protein NVSMB2_20020 [Chloroflexota bacterium]